jgi:NTE family protein
MGIIRPLGLALSGGGFRATAFHLGVLKRLRELGLLAQVDALSTVSGGSIAGAYWVYWQALQGDTIVDASEWDRFETSLIHAMRSGLREWIWFRGFVVPSLLLGVVVGMVAILLGLSSVTSTIELAALVLTGAYIHWHARASNILQARYDQLLFNGCKLHDLSSVPHPAGESGVLRLIVKENLTDGDHIFMNATGLETGAHCLPEHC